MISLKDQYFLRITLLLMKGCGQMSRETLYREIRNSGKTIEQLLAGFEGKLKHQFHEKQTQKFFPESGTTNIEEWDVAMLTGILLTLFKSTLHAEEKRAIKSIKYVRNEIYAHRQPSSMDLSDYEDTRNELEEAVKFLSSRFDVNVQEKYEKVVKECTDGLLDAASFEQVLEEVSNSTELLNEIITKQNEFFGAIKQEIQTEHAKTREEIADQRAKLNKICKILEEREQNMTKILTVVGVEITLTGDKEKPELLDAAERILRDVFDKAIEKTGSDEYTQVMTAVQRLLEETETPETKALSAEQQCIVLKFQCTSYASLLKLLRYLGCKDFRESLENISIALQEIQHLTKPYSISSRFLSEDLDAILKELTNAPKSETYSRTVELSSLRGNADMSEKDGASNCLNKIAETISTRLRTNLTLKPLMQPYGEENTTEELGKNNEEKPLLTDSLGYACATPDNEKYTESLQVPIGMQMKMQTLHDSREVVTSTGPLVFVSGTHTICFITCSFLPFYKTVMIAEKKMNVNVLVELPFEHAILVTVDNDRKSKELETGRSTVTAIREKHIELADRSTVSATREKHIALGTRVYKVGGSGLTEGIVTEHFIVSEMESGKKNYMNVETLPGSSRTPFAEIGDSGCPVFTHIEDKWNCIGMLLGMILGRKKIYVVRCINDVIDKMQKTSGKQISLDHQTMALQISERFEKRTM